ncbi:class IIb bacteriocin, lactobin A/cerein 7B family [Flavobacterium sp. j3]|jgi:hypothetical protein|uniref:Class IIb bacteriocin, lactobin A/cerein 7B family n=1 Tax=Flavobacterium aureirubrum TaxID=3133147 RepID=A0ABU9N725_9FLAO
MNLENLNLVELNAQEKQETEGGLIFAILGAAAAVAGIATVLYGAGYAVGSAYAHYQNNNK